LPAHLQVTPAAGQTRAGNSCNISSKKIHLVRAVSTASKHAATSMLLLLLLLPAVAMLSCCESDWRVLQHALDQTLSRINCTIKWLAAQAEYAVLGYSYIRK
jgi:hypothetical protein